MGNMELHNFVPGERTYVISCCVVRHDEKRMTLTARPPHDANTIFYIEAVGKSSLIHDQFPPLVQVAMNIRNSYGRQETWYSSGHLYDLSILSDVNKMILIVGGWTGEAPASGWIHDAVA